MFNSAMKMNFYRSRKFGHKITDSFGDDFDYIPSNGQPGCRFFRRIQMPSKCVQLNRSANKIKI